MHFGAYCMSQRAWENESGMKVSESMWSKCLSLILAQKVQPKINSIENHSKVTLFQGQTTQDLSLRFPNE